MQCPGCEAENPPSARFCISCGKSLSRTCPACKSESPPAARFCANCGTSLLNPAASGEPPRTSSANDGERRHLTVLFCDLVDSTISAARMDPEDWRAAIAAYHRAAAEAVTRFGGHVAKFMGDGVMAFFGYPEAHENDAERGIRASLAILDALAKMNDAGGQIRLAARIGLDSGSVVVGHGAGSDADVFGDTPNIAARVQSAAESETLMISANTQRLTAGLFIVKDCGPQVLKGIAQPMRLYRVIRPSGARGRLEAAAGTHGLTPFVGREDELSTLRNRWQRARDGEGQVVLIVGEAGIGKSRVLHRFRESIADTPHTWIHAAADSFFQTTPFHAVAEMLRLSFFAQGESTSDGIGRMAEVLSGAGLQPGATIPLLAPLLNLTLPPEYPPLQLPADQQRRRLLRMLVEWIFARAAVRPLIIAIEDLHWADPSTIELLQLLVEQGSAAPLLQLYTARPEFHPPWPLRSQHSQIVLNRLSSHNIRAMVSQVAAQKALSDDTVAVVIERTGGVPLFVEELTRAVLESGDGKMTGRGIPETLHDSLMARLDRLGAAARETLQLGAVLGSEFSYELLCAAHRIAEPELQRRLRTLSDAELLYVRGIAPEARYQFKHALIREVAYEALLKSRRRETHLLVAKMIESDFPEIHATHPEVLARHWTEAGELEAAIREWSRTGKINQERSAFAEARQNYNQALSLIELIPESSQRDLLELELRQAIVRLLWVTSGYSAPETIAATEQAAAMAEKSGQLQQLLTWLLLKCTTALVSGEFSVVSALLEQAMGLAHREGSAAGLGNVHELYEATYFLRGMLPEVETHFAAGSEQFARDDFRRLPGAAIAAYGWAAWNAWALGHVDAARKRLDDMTKAANAESPYDVAFAAVFSTTINFYFGNFHEAEVTSRSALAIAQKHRFPYIAALLLCIRGQILAQMNRPADGVELIREGIAELAKVGSHLRMSNFRGWLAQCQAQMDDLVGALATVEEALSANCDEVIFHAELLTIRGLVELKKGDAQKAENDFREATSHARKINARSWELRASIPLAHLLRNSDRRGEALATLMSVYSWFNGSSATPELKEAKSLIDDLQG